MKTKVKAFVAVILAACVLTAFMLHTNRGPFQGDSVAGLPDGRIRAMEPERQSHIDLLLNRRGGAYFNHFGEQVHVYIAFYHRDELVLHEVVGGIGTVGDWELSGYVIWGLTTENNRASELRARVIAGGAMGFGFFDFSQLDFDPGMKSGPQFTTEPIERGRRYALEVWQSGTRFVVGRDPFDPEILRQSENTAILYIIFG